MLCAAPFSPRFVSCVQGFKTQCTSRIVCCKYTAAYTAACTAAGAAVYSLSLPVLLLAGEGSTAVGLVASLQAALQATPARQPLVLHVPRLEVQPLDVHTLCLLSKCRQVFSHNYFDCLLALLRYCA
jgi:hypothetical protein